MMLQVMGSIIAPIALSITVLMIGVILSTPALTIIGIVMLVASFAFAGISNRAS